MTNIQNKNLILVYKDTGVSPECFKQTMNLLKNTLDPTYEIQSIRGSDIALKGIPESAALFILPGGSDIPYTLKLNGAGNLNIQEYVENGGSFLGICAGSYYGAAFVEFDKGGKQEVIGERELAFFKGNAIGPILAPYSYTSPSGSLAAKINTVFDNIPEAYTFYNGGGFFEDAYEFENTKILATYENDLAAIIHIQCGKGNVVLSSVHFEYNPDLLNQKEPLYKNIIPLLKKYNWQRDILTSELMQILKVKTHENLPKCNPNHLDQSRKKDPTPSGIS
ncbi:MAG: hypothetical protein S4CHLAM20_11480 [Chlamydiia bacterium]|nr:hypothetical protein [Chlamydiia bacterium]